MKSLSPARPRWEMADVLRRFGDEFCENNRISADHGRILRHIEQCRTAELGGHMEQCDSCEHERPVYNSCRDRHCPKCQTVAKEKWLEARKSELLSVPYFHNVFTLPHELNSLILANKRVMLGILFRAVSETLLQFGRDSRSRLGGLVGFSLILHTWNQKLLDHFHLHCVIPAGALSKCETKWIRPKHKDYLFSVLALSKVFRARYLALLQGVFEEGELEFVTGGAEKFPDFVSELRKKDWVVYSKSPFGGPDKVLDYLGRYTHKVAISNHRITGISRDTVTFSHRDREAGGVKEIAISGGEFIRRFLLHALPSGFIRIRHYGFLSSKRKGNLLEKCRGALGRQGVLKPRNKITTESIFEKMGIDPGQCPHCKHGRLRKTQEIPKILRKFCNTS